MTHIFYTNIFKAKTVFDDFHAKQKDHKKMETIIY